MKILLVEDERKVANLIKKGFEEEGLMVDIAEDGEIALEKVSADGYDLIILDIMLPGKDGIEVLKEIRARGIMKPIMMLTAKDSTTDKVLGLDAGADDYITKPFVFEELLARVRALLRRGHAIEKAQPIQIHDLIIDPVTRKVTRAGKEIELTTKEYGLLEYMARNKNRILTRTMIAENVWDYQFDSLTNIIDVYINYLRKKIDKDHQKKLIHTVRGVGYMIKE
ncbi:MAG: response regulator transcription factor [Proteobacteria bacterium]|nr:response regulator transcription factor [Pseudomonadota bacterium]